jgi:hypothetical protein
MALADQLLHLKKWKMMININLGKAKEITKDKLRAERTPLLQNLDVQFQLALETGADTSAIVTEKQRLRDITKLVDEAQTLDDLKAIRVT